MSEHAESLLVIKTERPLTKEQREDMMRALTPIAKQRGMVPLILDAGLDAGIHSDTAPILRDMLAEQSKTNQLLAALISALGEDVDPDDEPLTYMDGTPLK